jgi:choline dehydrogenase-like flavoprotein
MTIHDFRNLEPGTALDADLCIVGSGPAGWTIAEELRGTGVSVLVLESGGVLESGVHDREADLEELNEIDDVGVPLFNTGRRRTLGGTPESIPWGGRCIAFDPIDYRARPWVPWSGWPIGEHEVTPYLDRASRHLGAGPYLPGGPVPCGVAKPAVDPDKLSNVCWAFGRDPDGETLRYGRLFRQRRHPNIRVLVHATVTHLNTNTVGNRIESVEIGHSDRQRATVTARAVVLCTGGVENPRLLLASNRVAPGGLGNANDLVGRFLMDHPRDLNMAVTLHRRHAPVLRRLFGPYLSGNGEERRQFAGGFALSESIQQGEELLNAAAWPVEQVSEQDDPFFAAQRMKRAGAVNVRDLRRIAASPRLFLHSVGTWARRDRPFRYKVDGIGFFIASEQRPDPDSRITLTDRLDRLGLPVLRTNWRISAQDRETQAVLAKVIAAEFRRLGLPEARPADWVLHGRHEEARLSDGCHPTGTTRMSDDPGTGVVDPDGQVHGVDGLFIAGSSVFPTAGHANPTLMIVAMAVRLAEHLRTRLRANRGEPIGGRTVSDPALVPLRAAS